MPHDSFEIRFLRSAGTLVERGDSVLVAFSGGADSACMLHLFVKMAGTLGVKVGVFHMDHGIRSSAEIEAERVFVRAFCAGLGVELHLSSADVPALAEKHRASVEEEARKVRYQRLLAAAERHGYSKCATAHHADDSSEGLLLKLMKGASPSSLCGISPRLGKKIVRPMLFATKDEIAAYNEKNGVRSVDDSTNSDIRYERNYVRHRIIPAIREFCPSFSSKVADFQNIARQESELIDSLALAFAERYFERGSDGTIFVDSSEFEALHVAVRRRAILAAIRELGEDPAQAGFGHIAEALEFIGDDSRNGQFRLAGRKLFIAKKWNFDIGTGYRRASSKIGFFRHPAAGPDNSAYPDAMPNGREKKSVRAARTIDRKLRLDRAQLNAGERVSFSIDGYGYVAELREAGKDHEFEAPVNGFAYSPSGAVRLPLTIRPAAPGERMAVRTGEGRGTKAGKARAGEHFRKISDILSGARVHIAARPCIPLICDAGGTILAAGNIKYSEGLRPLKTGDRVESGSLILTVSAAEPLI